MWLLRMEIIKQWWRTSDHSHSVRSVTSMAISCALVHVSCILVAATIQGWHLFCSELPTVQLYYLRAVSDKKTNLVCYYLLEICLVPSLVSILITYISKFVSTEGRRFIIVTHISFDKFEVLSFHKVTTPHCSGQRAQAGEASDNTRSSFLSQIGASKC